MESGDGQPRSNRATTARRASVTRTPVKRGESRLNSGYPGQVLGRSKFTVQISTHSVRKFCVHRCAAKRTAKRLSPVRYRPRSCEPSIMSSKSNVISELRAGIQPGSLVGIHSAIVGGHTRSFMAATLHIESGQPGPRLGRSVSIDQAAQLLQRLPSHYLQPDSRWPPGDHPHYRRLAARAARVAQRARRAPLRCSPPQCRRRSRFGRSRATKHRFSCGGKPWPLSHVISRRALFV